ncbi:MAG: phosphatidylglycerol lysyltransferase [Spirochaetaceae bacterium]|nr:phosphatidylglycerol lysyltransferase [Spirochaetaceae bacterium]
MSMIMHPQLGFPIGDPQHRPLDPAALPSAEEIRKTVSSLILSASGWRKVFASHRPEDQHAPWSTDRTDEDSLSPMLSPADTVLCAHMAAVFADAILARSRSARTPVIALGIDARPTGPAIADCFARVLATKGCEVRYLFIVSAPEIMAWAGACAALPEHDPDHLDGFAYISASHNPPGHNGVKFGTGGGVLSAVEIAPLIQEFRTRIEAPDAAAQALALLAAPAEQMAACYRSALQHKRHSASTYFLFSHEVLTGEHAMEAQTPLLDMLAAELTRRPLGIVAELNGSARAAGIDREWLEGLGISVRTLHDRPRDFVHRIVPEGSSLEICRQALEQAHAEDPRYQLGYVPDCDGDRGNLVYWSERLGRAEVLEAQQVFALACLSELATLRWRGMHEKLAVVVNDATSMRIEALAEALGATVFRTETGEANVVARAEELRSQGWIVRILGEGSNGGTIIHPSKVRDPLSTIGSMLKLLRLGNAAEANSLFHLWLEACGRGDCYRPDYTIDDVIASLPGWATTSVFEPYAALKVRTADKAALKQTYGRLFIQEWPRMAPLLQERYGITAWTALASIGTEERPIGTDFGAVGPGGLKILLKDSTGRAKAFLWMRGSGTEPVFRIMVDIRDGSPDDERLLREWHSTMVREADRLAAQGNSAVG